MLGVFSCAYWPPVCLLGEMSIKIFCPVFDWVVCFLLLSCMTCLYVLEIKPLLAITCKYLLPFLRLCFHFLMVFFAMEEFASLIKSYLFIFVFISVALGD